MTKVFRYRIYCNKQTASIADQWIEICRTLYNLALEQRRNAYRQHRKNVTFFQQSKQLTDLKKEFSEFSIYRDVLENVLKRVDRAYLGFFRRVKSGQKPGYPRFKGKGWYDSITFPKWGWKIKGKYLSVTRIGKFKIKLSRPIEGKIKEVTIRKTLTGKWFVSFTCVDVPEKPFPLTGKKVGIDVGCESFLTDSNGSKIDNPRFFKQSQDLLAKHQRALGRKNKDSNRRKKTKYLISRINEKIQNQRRDFHFKVAKKLLTENDTVFIEKLENWLTYRSLNKSMRDVAWFQFFSILKASAASAKRRVVEVPAKNTSQMCSACGEIVPKDLRCRIHSCSCGFITDRDHNAALNILRLGQSLQVASPK